MGLAEPADEEGGCDVVGEVGGEDAGGGGHGRKVEGGCVGFEDGEAAGVGFGEVLEGGDGAAVEFDGEDVGGWGGEQGAGQAAGARADLDDVARVHWAGGPDDPFDQGLVEEEVLAEGLLGVEAVSGDDVLERRGGGHCCFSVCRDGGGLAGTLTQPSPAGERGLIGYD